MQAEPTAAVMAESTTPERSQLEEGAAGDTATPPSPRDLRRTRRDLLQKAVDETLLDETEEERHYTRSMTQADREASEAYAQALLLNMSLKDGPAELPGTEEAMDTNAGSADNNAASSQQQQEGNSNSANVNIPDMPYKTTVLFKRCKPVQPAPYPSGGAGSCSSSLNAANRSDAYPSGANDLYGQSEATNRSYKDVAGLRNGLRVNPTLNVGGGGYN